MQSEDFLLRKGDLATLVEELKNQNAKKYDIVVPSSHLRMNNGIFTIMGGDVTDEVSNVLAEAGIAQATDIKVALMGTAHSNLATKLNIPKVYYDRMNIKDNKENLELLSHNVNHWLSSTPKNYFLRNFVDQDEKSGICRAVLSDRFKVIDNYDVLMASLEAIKETGIKLEIEHCDITEEKMYIRFINPNITIESPALLKNYRVPNGEDFRNYGIVSGFVLSNSEIGCGQFSIAPRAVVLACKNGMIFNDEKFAKTHLGGKMEQFSKIDWSEETKRKNKELIIAQTKDAIKYFASEDFFSLKIQELERKGQKKLEFPLDCVKNVTRHMTINDTDEREIVDYFMKGSDFNAFGVTQALTFFAHETSDADLQYKVETEAVEILSNIDKFDVPEKRKTVRSQMQQN